MAKLQIGTYVGLVGNGKKTRRLRLELNATQEDIAEVSGGSPRSVRRVETGELVDARTLYYHFAGLVEYAKRTGKKLPPEAQRLSEQLRSMPSHAPTREQLCRALRDWVDDAATRERILERLDAADGPTRVRGVVA